MPSSSTPGSCKDNVRQQRDRLRAQGLRPVQVWLPDTRSVAFRAEARRQSELIAGSSSADEDQTFVDAVSEWAGP